MDKHTAQLFFLMLLVINTINILRKPYSKNYLGHFKEIQNLHKLHINKFPALGKLNEKQVVTTRYVATLKTSKILLPKTTPRDIYTIASRCGNRVLYFGRGGAH